MIWPGPCDKCGSRQGWWYWEPDRLFCVDCGRAYEPKAEEVRREPRKAVRHG